jgi:hypothetical protein
VNEGIYEISSFSLACNMFCLKIELKIEKIYILNIQKKYMNLFNTFMSRGWGRPIGQKEEKGESFIFVQHTLKLFHFYFIYIKDSVLDYIFFFLFLFTRSIFSL